MLSPVSLMACQTGKTSEAISTCLKIDLTDKEKTDLINKANNGDNEASYYLYRYYAANDVDINIRDITQQPFWYWLRKSAADGHVTAQFLLSQVYLGDAWTYLKTPNNPEEGLYWLKKAAKNGHEFAQKELERYRRILNEGNLNCQ
jgi:TPR repeat protein